MIVEAFGFSQEYKNITEIHADAGKGNDSIQVASGVTAEVVFDGGEGDDSLMFLANDNGNFSGGGLAILRGGVGRRYAGGPGRQGSAAWRRGDDTLQGNGGDDELDGGAGADQLQGGDGDDSCLAVRRMTNSKAAWGMTYWKVVRASTSWWATTTALPSSAATTP